MYNKEQWLKGLKRNNAVYTFLRATLGVFYTKRFKFTFEPFEVKSDTFLLFSNHTNDNDPFFQALMFKTPLRFVAGEKILRVKPWGRIISYLVNPIPRKKGASSDDTIEYIKENLKLSINVAMFPEGVRTINGRTGHISPRTAKLVKDSCAGLVLVRFSGAYMRSPVWAKYKRRGPVKGIFISEYTRDELNKMSVDEINDILHRDLYTNAYDEQRREKIKYKGKNLAEGLENALYICPVCKSIGKIYGSLNSFKCGCGYSVELNEEGFFYSETNDVLFDDVLKWDLWQREYIKNKSTEWLSNTNYIITSDTSINLYEVQNRKKLPVAKQANLRFYADRLHFESAESAHEFQLKDISRMSNFKSSTLLFTYKNKYYEAHAKQWPVFKYIALYRIMTGQKYL